MKLFEHLYVTKHILLNEAGLVFPNQHKEGQATILVGGPGSGKGFIRDNILLKTDRTFDIDSFNELIVQYPALKLHKQFKNFLQQEFKEYTANINTVVKDNNFIDAFNREYPNQNIQVYNDFLEFAQTNGKEFARFYKKYISELKNAIDNLNLKSLNYPYIVGMLHNFKYYKGLKYKDRGNFIAGLKSKKSNVLPNIVFDITGSTIESVEEVLEDIEQMGYDPKDVNIVWVLTPVKEASSLNKSRARKVGDIYLHRTHNEVKTVLNDILFKNAISKNYFDGTFYIIFNSQENQDIKTNHYNDKKTIKSFEKFLIKMPGRPISFKDYDRDWEQKSKKFKIYTQIQ